MSEQLEKKLIDYMDKTVGAIETALELSIEKAPLIVKEILNYGFWTGVLWAVVSSSLIFLCAVKYKRLGIQKKQLSYSEKIDFDISQMLIFLILMVLSFVFTVNIQNVLKITIAPKVYVIDHLRGNK